MLRQRLSDILSDTVSGASSLYRRVLYLLGNDPSLWTRSERKRIVGRLRKTFPEMAVFVYLQERLQGVKDDAVGDAVALLRAEAEEETGAVGRRLDRIWKTKRRVVTFSQSSLVMRLLRQRRERIDGLLISAGSPRHEGILAATGLAAAGIPVELATDAALPGLVRRNDLIIVGADAVTERYFVNKCGTLPLLLSARAAGAVSVVVYERFKRIAAGNIRVIPRQHPPGEILVRRRRGIRVTNVYFEAIPTRYADWLLSGDTAVRGYRR